MKHSIVFVLVLFVFATALTSCANEKRLKTHEVDQKVFLDAGLAQSVTLTFVSETRIALDGSEFFLMKSEIFDDPIATAQGEAMLRAVKAIGIDSTKAYQSWSATYLAKGGRYFSVNASHLGKRDSCKLDYGFGYSSELNNGQTTTLTFRLKSVNLSEATKPHPSFE